MTLLEALRLVYEGRAYGARPASWVANGDVYVWADNQWRYEFNENHWLHHFSWPTPENLFGDWCVLSKEQVAAERKVAKACG